MTTYDCIRVWDNGDSWRFQCKHQHPDRGAIRIVCGREQYGYGTQDAADADAKSHHWVNHGGGVTP